MSDVSKMISNVSSLSKKIGKELIKLSMSYDELFNEVDRRFKEELSRQNGKINGLEDFYSLFLSLKQDRNKIRNSAHLMGGLRDISQFNVSEEALEEERENRLLKESAEIQDIIEKVAEKEGVDASELPDTTIDELLEEIDDK